MRRTLRAGRPGYLPLGIIAGSIVGVWILIWIRDGPTTNAWQPIVIIGGAYGLYAVGIRARVIDLSEETITCHYLIRKPRRIAWREVRRIGLTYWTDGSPFQIILWGESATKAMLDIPLPWYSKADRDFLYRFVQEKVVTV